MNDTPRTARWPLWGWYPLALLWLVLLVMLALLTVFRALKNIGSADLIQFDDVPILHYFDLNYAKLFWSTAGLAAVFFCGLAAACWFLGHNRPGWPWQAWRSRSPRCWVAGWLPVAVAAFTVLALVACAYRSGKNGGPVEVAGAGATGWLIVTLVAAAGWLLTRAVVLTPQGNPAGRCRRSAERMLPPACPNCDDAACASPTLPDSWDESPYSAAVSDDAPAAVREIAEPAAIAVPTRAPWLGRLATVFLLCFAVTYVEAALAHRKFWDPKKNGNYNYRPFFAEDELRDADLVLHSTSMAFVSLAALGGCLWFGVFHWLVPGSRTVWLSRARPPASPGCQPEDEENAAPHPAVRPWTDARGSPVLTQSDCLRIVGLLAGLWTFALGVPWQIKLLPEIKAEDGWILTAIVLAFLLAALAPLLAVTLMLLRQDFAPRRGSVPPRASEFALWTLVLFPFYPLLAWLPLGYRRVRYVLLAVVSAAMLARMMYTVTYIEEWFEFDDWRDMVKGAELPFLRVFVALMIACFLYLSARRAGMLVDGWLASRRRLRGLRWVRVAVQAVVILAAAACLTFASWPFWGWRNVHKNVFARCGEFSERHRFELGFLHWVFDCDRDGYAAVLDGADPDDFDPRIQAGGLGPPGVVVVPVDHFAVDDPAKAQRLPNLIVFYLEGVHPRAIGAYGQRRKSGKDGPTPNIDAVAAEGTVFTQARCFYPSTWDAWYATSTGRFMRIAEMHAADLFGDRYSPHNNLYKVLYLAGFDRWCHADIDPYCQLLVPPKLHEHGKPAWNPPKFDSRLSKKDEANEIWRGDKRTDRMVAFLDDIQPGERFFMCEHMADTHFPWKRTGDARARELGFPKGLEFCEDDAILPNGATTDIFKRYYQTITRMDGQIGRIIDKLRQRKLYDNTMIAIVSDHGCQWWEHERMYYVSHVYDQSLLVPLIVRVPPAMWAQYGFSRDRQARQYGEPVLQADILPTVMDLAGVRHRNADATGPLPGRSLLPAMFSRGKSRAELDALAAEYRDRDVPLMTHYDMRGVIHDGRYKLIFDRPRGTYLLFDLQTDPKEMQNLADAKPALLDDMLERLRVLFTENKTLLGSMEEDETWGP